MMAQVRSLLSLLRSPPTLTELARKAAQISFLALFSSAIMSLPIIPLTLPILFSSGIPNRTVEEALSVIQRMIYDAVFPWLPLASIILFGVLSGRVLCGWICPLGFIQDILAISKVKRIEVSSKTHRGLVGIKYVILTSTLLISISFSLAQFSETGRTYREMLGIFAQAPFTSLSPSDTLLATLPRLLSDIALSIYSGFNYSLIKPLLITRIIVLIAVLALAIYVPRAWCRYLCPQGAFSAIASRFSLLGLRRDPVRCFRARCHTCEDVCPMKVPILSQPREKFTDPECIYCLKCVMACPMGAIKPKFP